MSEPNLLIAVPMKHDLDPQLQARAEQIAANVAQNRGNRHAFGRIHVAFYVDRGDGEPAGSGMFGGQARARNAILDQHLKHDHDYVFWIDADIVELEPLSFPSVALRGNPDGITAPMIMVGDSTQFYDTLGFIEDGRRIGAWYPYFSSLVMTERLPTVVRLDSVGCVYLIPANVYRETGARYESIEYRPGVDHPTIGRTGHTDHWPVMEAARESGRNVLCFTGATARHAFLPDYGERWH